RSPDQQCDNQYHDHNFHPDKRHLIPSHLHLIESHAFTLAENTCFSSYPKHSTIVTNSQHCRRPKPANATASKVEAQNVTILVWAVSRSCLRIGIWWMRHTRMAPAQNMESTRPSSSRSIPTPSRPPDHIITERNGVSSDDSILMAAFHAGYYQTGTYPGKQENVETPSKASIGISSLSTTSPFALPFFSISSWIIFLYTGHGVAALPLSSRSSRWTKETQNNLSELVRSDFLGASLLLFSSPVKTQEMGHEPCRGPLLCAIVLYSRNYTSCITMAIRTVMRKWGNSLGVVIPREEASKEGLHENDEVEIVIRKAV